MWQFSAIAWLGVIGWLTLRSAPNQVAQVAELRWYCIACGDSGVADLILNTILFLPLGVAAHALGWSLRRTVLTVLPITVGIELTQGFVLIGRDAALGDVLSNTAGGAIGWLLFPALCALTAPTPATARRTLRWLVPAVALFWFLVGSGFEPVLSGAGPYTGQIMHLFGTLNRYPGSVTDATFGGIAVPNEEMALVPAATRTVDVSFTAQQTSAQLRTSSASLVRVVDRDSLAQVTVNERDGEILFQVPLRASSWLLHTPTWRFDDVLNLPLNTSARVQVTATERAVVIAREGGGTMTAHFTPSIGQGWVFIHPFTGTLQIHSHLWTVLWIGWWFALLGWLAGAAGRATVAVTSLWTMAAWAGASLLSGVPIVGWEMLVGLVVLLGAAAAAVVRSSSP